MLFTSRYGPLLDIVAQPGGEKYTCLFNVGGERRFPGGSASPPMMVQDLPGGPGGALELRLAHLTAAHGEIGVPDAAQSANMAIDWHIVWRVREYEIRFGLIE